MLRSDSVVRSTNPQTLAEGARLIIMKADLLAYGTVFEFAALAMLIGGFLALLLLRASQPQALPAGHEHHAISEF